MRTNERRAEIMRILVGRRFETMKRLAEEFGVSRQTIYSDILALTAEYPLETVRGNGGGIKVSDCYYTYKNLFSREQQQVLMELVAKSDKHQAEVLVGLLNAYGSSKELRNSKCHT